MSVSPAERDLISSVARYLGKNESVAFSHRMNVGATKIGSRFIRFAFPGCPDFIGMLRGGRFFCVECKAPKGRLSPEQSRFIGLVNRFGGLAVVARSVGDVKLSLDDFKLHG